MFRNRCAVLGGVLAVAVLLAAGLRAVAAADPTKPKETQAPRDDSKRGLAPADQDVQKQLDDLRREVADMKRQLDQLRGGRPAFTPGPPSFPGAGEAPRYPGFPGGYPGMRFGQHARLGVMVDPPSETLADQLGLKKGQGLVVREVVQDSPASKAGLKPHDILVELNGKPVPGNVGEFAQMVSDIKADTPVDARVLRKGKEETVKGIKLGEAQPQFGRPGGVRPPGQPGQPGGPPR
jgi:hypothetical protein